MAGTKRLFRVGSKILEIRSAFGLTQGELGTLIGVHVVTVNRWEQDLLAPTSWQHALLTHLAKATPRLKVRLSHDPGALRDLAIDFLRRTSQGEAVDPTPLALAALQADPLAALALRVLCGSPVGTAIDLATALLGEAKIKTRAG